MGKMGELVLYVCMASLLVGPAKGQSTTISAPNAGSSTAIVTSGSVTGPSQPASTNQPAMSITSSNSSSAHTTSNNTSSNGTMGPSSSSSSSSPASVSQHPDTTSSTPPRFSTRIPQGQSTLSTQSTTTTNTLHPSGVTNSSGHARTTSVRPSASTPNGGTSPLLGSLLLVPAISLLIQNM